MDAFSLGYLGAGIGAGLVALGAGLGIGRLAAAALIEGVALFGLVICILMALNTSA
jgi:F-type H+-transporting ATPase subunit c